MERHPELDIGDKTAVTQNARSTKFHGAVLNTEQKFRHLDVENLSVEELSTILETHKNILNQHFGEEYLNQPTDLIAQNGYITDAGSNVIETIDGYFILNGDQTTFLGADIIQVGNKWCVVLQFAYIPPDQASEEVYYNVLPPADMCMAVETPPERDIDVEFFKVWAAHSQEIISSSHYAEEKADEKRAILREICDDLQDDIEKFTYITDTPTFIFGVDTMYKVYDDRQMIDPAVFDASTDKRPFLLHIKAEVINVHFPEEYYSLPPAQFLGDFCLSGGTPWLLVRNVETDECHWIPVDALRSIALAA